VNVSRATNPISNVSANTFDITVPIGGGISGTQGAYSVGFNYAHSGSGTRTGGIITAPSTGGAILNMVKLKANVGTTYDIDIPAGTLIGNTYDNAGGFTSRNDAICPTFRAYQDSDTFPAIAATIAVNQGTNYHTLRFGSLGATANKHLTVIFN
jgi:hypothetical protein